MGKAGLLAFISAGNESNWAVARRQYFVHVVSIALQCKPFERIYSL